MKQLVNIFLYFLPFFILKFRNFTILLIFFVNDIELLNHGDGFFLNNLFQI